MFPILIMLTLTKISTGETFTTLTNSFGYYSFENLASGEDYLLTPSAKGYQFSPPNRIVSLTEDLTDIDFQGANQ